MDGNGPKRIEIILLAAFRLFRRRKTFVRGLINSSGCDTSPENGKLTQVVQQL